VYQAARDFPLDGTVWGKVFWYEKRKPFYGTVVTDMTTTDIEDTDLVYACPVIQIVPPDEILPDPNALHADVQRHRGIGHRVKKTYEQCRDRFSDGTYTMNRAEFERRFKESGGNKSDEDALDHDADSDVVDDNTTWLAVWEWHGEVPFDAGTKEIMLTIITSPGEEDPAQGVLVRLLMQPALECGLRPFVCAQYTPAPSPYGVGILEREQDILHQISQLVCQFEDNARLSVNMEKWVIGGSEAAADLKKNPETTPGRVHVVMSKDEIGYLDPAPFNPQAVINLIGMLREELQRRTISDLQASGDTAAESATEANILQAQSQTPVRTKTDIFARSFLKPAVTLALAMLKQHTLDTQRFTVKDDNGAEIPLEITPEELQQGEFRVSIALTQQDHTRIARAQSMERMMSQIPNIMPLLQMEGKRPNIGAIFNSYINLLDLPNSDRFIEDIAPREQMLMQQIEQLQQQLMEMQQAPSGPQKPQQPANGNGKQPDVAQAPPLLENGGPIGDVPTDTNAIMQMLQFNANPQVPGGTPS